MAKIEFFRHSVDEADIARAAEVLRSIFLTTGKTVDEFERDMAAYLGAQAAVGVTSCTAALHLSLLAWGIGPGDEVITTPMTFCATANAILQAGATPVFVDVEESSGNLNAELVERKITSRTRAIMPVHLYGYMCDMRRLRDIADKHKLIIIEDAAHCLEGARDGVRVGQLAEAACYSFYATKSITSGEGGAISLHDPGKADLLKTLRSHGIDRTAADRYTAQYRHWDMSILGWKYNMDNIQAALLIGQLKRAEALRGRRNALAQRYEAALAGGRGVRLHKTAPSAKHGRHLFTIVVSPEKRDGTLHFLQENGVGVAVNYTAVHLLSYYRGHFGHKAGDFPAAEAIGAGTISLPLYPKLTDAEQDYVVAKVIEAVKS